MKNRNYLWMVIVVFMSLAFLLPATPVSATKTAKIVSLKPGHSYKKYDITGDGKVDKIKVSKQTKEQPVASMAPIYSVKVTVNKKFSFNVSSAMKKVDLRCFYKGKKGVLISNDFYATAANVINWYKISKKSVTIVRISGEAYNASYKKSGSKLVLTLISSRPRKTTKMTYKLKGAELVR